MKYFVIITLFLITLQISHQNKFTGKMLTNYFKTHEEVRKHCMVEISVDKKLESIFEDSGDIPPNDENFLCFARCLMVKSGAINEAGDVFPENIARNLQIKDISVVEKVKIECSNFDRVDLCKGDFCTIQSSGVDGICKLLSLCPSVLETLQTQGTYPQTCSFLGTESIVCCPVIGGAINNTSEILKI